jgi:hypothetical protein
LADKVSARLGPSSLEAAGTFALLNGAEPRAPASRIVRGSLAATRHTLGGSVLAQATELPLERTSAMRSPLSSISQATYPRRTAAKLISYIYFSQLRLADFLPLAVSITRHRGFEWMGGVGRYEGIGFTDDDRSAHVFRLGAPDLYEVSCTISDKQGRIHVSIIRNDLRRLLAVA